MGCPDDTGDLATCSCILLLIRYGFALFLMECLMVLILTQKGIFAKNVNERMWIAKCAFLLILTIFMFFVSPGFFQIVLEIAKIVSILFAAMIIIVYLDLSYRWGEHWWELYNEKGAGIIGALLILVSIFLYGLTGYLTYKNFDWFTSNDCNVNKNLIILTIIL